MTTNRLTLRLEPQANCRLIAGWLCDERGDEHYFTDWLGLLTLLERARADSDPRAGAGREADGEAISRHAIRARRL